MAQVVGVPRADVEHQERFQIFIGIRLSVFCPYFQEIAPVGLDACAIQIALCAVTQMRIDGAVTRTRGIPFLNFRFLLLAHPAAVVSADKLLSGNAVQLKGRSGFGGKRGSQHTGDGGTCAQACGKQQSRMSAIAAQNNQQGGEQQRIGEQTVVAQERTSNAADDVKHDVPTAGKEGLGSFNHLPCLKHHDQYAGGEQRVLAGGNRHDREYRHPCVCGSHQHADPCGRAATLNEYTAIRQRKGKGGHL